MGFRCHYCNEQIKGDPKLVVAMIMGFIWNPSRFEWPAWFFDYCSECKDVYISKYEEGRDLRRKQVEIRKLADWSIRHGLIRKTPGYSLDYRKKYVRPFVILKRPCGQMEYHFSNN